MSVCVNISAVIKTKCEIRLGDCENVLTKYSEDFFDLIVTSPPYADSRARTYGGIKTTHNVDWFFSRTAEFLENIFTGEKIKVSAQRTLLCSEVFAHFPVAVLVSP